MQQDLAAISWTWIVIAGTVVLGLVLAYAMYRSSKATPRQQAESEAGARRLYNTEGGEQRRNVMTTPVGIALGLVIVVALAAIVFTFWESGPADVEPAPTSTDTPAVESPGG